jgi:signal transduction histidine kinase
MIAWALIVASGSYLALHRGVWIPPSAALIMLVISYPLWSWRRLEAAIAYLGEEFIRLDKEPHLLPEDPNARKNTEVADVLEQRMSAMQNAARRVRDLRQFVSDNLDNLPDATLIADTNGCILFANKHAYAYYRSLGITDIHGMSVIDLLNLLSTDKPQPVDQAANLAFAWPDLLNIARIRSLHAGVAIQDRHGRDLLVKSAACLSASTHVTGWIVSVLNISTLRAAERSRDETLRFLSHDMRAPQASILALLELQSEASSALSQQEFFARIEKASRKTLGLADNFVQLARAESHEYRLEELDFQDILIDASDEMWSLAKSKRITISVEIAEGDYPVTVDRALMTRALTNLISNAINYSPEERSILCSLYLQEQAQNELQSNLSNHLPADKAPARIVCSIRDHGYGIADADQAKLFRRFHRVDVPNQGRHDGVGLGLVFVKTVIERHQGSISFSSKTGEGTVFTITLPAIHTPLHTPS